MQLFGSGLSLLTLALSLSGTAASSHHGRHLNRQHHDLAKRVDGSVNLWKRFEAARWTFFDVGLGACGIVNVESDFIVALNSAQFGGGYPGPNCFKMITMSYNGKTTKAQITDECPGCPYGGLDLSRGLFRFFAPESVGVLSGDWWFDGEGDDKPAPPPPPPPPKTTHQDSPKPTTTEEPEKPKPTPKPTPTTTEKPDPTTTSNDKKPSSSSSSSKASKASSTVTLATTSIDLSKGVASGLVQPTGTINTGDNSPDNWYQINLALVGMGAVLVAGAETGA